MYSSFTRRETGSAGKQSDSTIGSDVITIKGSYIAGRPEAIMLLFPLLFYSALLSILPIYSPIFCPLFCNYSPKIRRHDKLYCNIIEDQR